MNKISVDLWALVLSFTPLSKVFPIMLTCKRFHEASQKELFWSRHARKRFSELFPECPLPFPAFLSSCFVHNRIFESQAGWIVANMDTVLTPSKDDDKGITRKCIGTDYFKFLFFVSEEKIVTITVYVSSSDTTYGFWKNYTCDDNEIQEFSFNIINLDEFIKFVLRHPYMPQITPYTGSPFNVVWNFNGTQIRAKSALINIVPVGEVDIWDFEDGGRIHKKVKLDQFPIFKR